MFRRFDVRETPLVARMAGLERHGWVRWLMLMATRSADGWALFVVLPVAMLVGGARGFAACTIGIMGGVALALAVHGIKHAVKRRRPEVDTQRPISALDLHAFPSGHTAHAFSVAVLAFWLSPWLGLAWLPWAVIVGFSRVFFGLHYPSDVFAGAMLGSASAFVFLHIAEATGLVAWLCSIWTQ